MLGGVSQEKMLLFPCYLIKLELINNESERRICHGF